MLKACFHKQVLSRRWATFLVMGVAFLCFGASSINLFYLFSANFIYISTYGLMALLDGGLLQLAELLLNGYLSLAAYLVFKACEHELVLRITTKT